MKIFKAWASDEDLRGKIIANSGYACRIVTNCYLDHTRVPSRAGRDEVPFDAWRHGRAGTRPDDDLRIAVLSLAENERDVIIFRYYHDLTFAKPAPSSASPRRRRAGCTRRPWRTWQGC